MVAGVPRSDPDPLRGPGRDANLDVRRRPCGLAKAGPSAASPPRPRLPAINGDASYQRELFSQNGLVSLEAACSAGHAIRPPISIYNRLRRLLGARPLGPRPAPGRGRRAQVEAAEYQRRDLLVSTLAELARDYIQLRGAQAQIAISNDNLKTTNDILQLTQTRAATGLTNQLDVENAAAQVEGIRAQMPIWKTRNRWTSTRSACSSTSRRGRCGANSRGQTRPAGAAARSARHASELARRRPDIRAAEAQLHAATADIGVAVADFYPSVKLNRQSIVGLNALDLRIFGRGARCNMCLGRACRSRFSRAAGSNRP